MKTICLFDIIKLAFNNIKIVLLGMVIGALCSGLLITTIDAKYESRVSMELAYIENVNTGDYKFPLTNPIVIYDFLKSPGTYSEETIKLCGLVDVQASRVDLSRAIQVRIPKNQSMVINIRVVANSKEASLACINSLIDTVVDLQGSNISEIILRKNELIQKYTEQVLSLRKAVGAISDENAATYRQLVNEIDFFNKKIFDTSEFIGSYYNADVISPAYTLDQPAEPSAVFYILFGLMLGFVISIVYLVARN
jgi:hypothetical protein